MKTYTVLELQAIFFKHAEWLGGVGVECANLSGAYLFGAYLFGAYLFGAYLFGANLFGANLPHYKIIPQEGEFIA